jgi:flagellin
MTLFHHALSLTSGLSRSEALTDASSSRISSGRRLDRPAADSAGVGQAAKLDSDQARLRAAEVNIQNGVSRMQVTSSHLGILGRVVTRLSELAALGGNPIQSASDRALYSDEFRQLQTQLRQIVGGTKAEIGGVADIDQPIGNFSGRPLFGPGPAESLVIGSGDDDRVQLPVIPLRGGAVGALLQQDAAGVFNLGPETTDSATLAATLRDALSQIADSQAQVGAGQSRLTLAASVASTASANHEAALGTIRDADIATETTLLARFQIVSEGHTAMLVQARDVTAKLLPLLARN